MNVTTRHISLYEEYENLWGVDPDVVADINQDDILNVYDIDLFIQLIAGG